MSLEALELQDWQGEDWMTLILSLKTSDPKLLSPELTPFMVLIRPRSLLQDDASEPLGSVDAFWI